MKRCSLESLSPNRRQNQCISYHCHGRQGSDDDGTCKINFTYVNIELCVIKVQDASDENVSWRWTTRVVGHCLSLSTRRSSDLICWAAAMNLSWFSNFEQCSSDKKGYWSTAFIWSDCTLRLLRAHTLKAH